MYDDHVQIVKNPQIQSWDNLPRLLTTDVWSRRAVEREGHEGHYYRPLFSFWLLIVWTFAGPNAWAWHASSVLLHAHATYLVYRLCTRLTRSNVAGFLSALVFAVHPIHVDSVSWISASNELLYANLVLGSLLLLCKAGDEGKTSWLILSLGLYMTALMSKETALACLPLFPIMWWLAALRRPGPTNRQQVTHGPLKITGLYAIPAFAYGVIRLIVLRGIGVEVGKHSWAQVLYSAPDVMAFYLSKLVYPAKLAGFYVNPLSATPTPRMLLTTSLLIASLVALVWLSHRRWAGMAIASALIIFPLLPSIAGIRLYEQGNMTHDRYLYLPSVGLCLILSLLFSAGLRREYHRSMVLLSTGMAALFAYSTIRQQQFYRDDDVYYQRAIEVDPRNATVMGYLGDVYLERSENDKAMAWFERAVREAPEDTNAKYHLARGLVRTKQFAAAVPYLKDLAYGADQGASKTRRSVLLLSLANAEIELGELDRAESTLDDLADFDFAFPGLHRTRGILFQREGRLEQARGEYSLEYRLSGDRESGRQATALSKSFSRTP